MAPTLKEANEREGEMQVETRREHERVLAQAVEGGKKARREIESGTDPMQLYRDAVARKSFWRAYASECWAAVARQNGEAKRANGTH